MALTVVAGEGDKAGVAELVAVADAVAVVGVAFRGNELLRTTGRRSGGESVALGGEVRSCGHGNVLAKDTALAMDDCRILLTEVLRHNIFGRMKQLLRVDNIVTVDTIESLGQLVITAIVIDNFLDLLSVELLIGENGAIRSEGADNTVAAEDCSAVVMLIQGADKIIDVGLIDVSRGN